MGVFRRTAGGCVLTVTMALAFTGAAQADWSGADSLTSGRYDHTATLLKDGHVLVAGGNDGGPLDSARLYDPDTGHWSDAETMHVARSGQAAVRLESGKVLVAGGVERAGDSTSPVGKYTRSAEIYDPAANTWKTAGNMSTGRFEPTMTLLDDGRVLVAGGSGDTDDGHGQAVSGAVPLASAEVYDPASDKWSDVASMSVARSMATATPLENGKVLVAGGFDHASGELRSAELFDPSNEKWSETGSLDDARDSATATALPNGDVLVAGGDGGGGALATAEVYDASAGTWHGAGDMTEARQSAAATALGDGSVLVTGGEDGRFGTLLASAERYDPASDTWTDAGPMAAARKQHTLTALADGRALVVGGNPGGFEGGLAGVERFSSAGATLTPARFGSQPVGTPSDVVDSVLTNTGHRPLNVTDVATAGHADFEIVSEACTGAPVQPGASCDIELRFTPAAAGARSATLTVTDGSTASGTTSAELTGTGQAADPAAGGAAPAGDAPATAEGGTAGLSTAAALVPGGGAVLAAHAAHRRTTRATCEVGAKRSHGRTRSTVTCRLTWPSSRAVTLRAWLVRGKATVGRATTAARDGRAALRLRPTRRLRAGRYTLVIARRDGTTVLRTTIRVP
jgi:N-acetylneuraminic acid mutarotase